MQHVYMHVCVCMCDVRAYIYMYMRCEEIFQRKRVSDPLLLATIETEATDVARHSPNCTYTRALCIYQKYRTGTYNIECRGQTVVKRVNT